MTASTPSRTRMIVPPPLREQPFTVAQAAAYDVDRNALDDLLACHAIRRVLIGVYAPETLPDTIELRARAAGLVLPPFAVACDRTAAWLWGVDTFDYRELEILPPLEVWSLRGNTRIRRVGCSGGIRDLSEEDIVEIAGVRLTEPLRTCLDLACRLSRSEALAVIDAFMRHHGITDRQLRAKLVRYFRRRGVLQARELVPLGDPRAESPGESWTRMAMIDHGLPAPELQHWVHDEGRPVFRLDVAYPKHKVAIEYDGREFHSGADRVAHDTALRRWLAAHGWTVIVVTKDDFDPESVVEWTREIRLALGAWIGGAA